MITKFKIIQSSPQHTGSTLLLKVDNSAIGYDLEADDEILAVGKFNS